MKNKIKISAFAILSLTSIYADAQENSVNSPNSVEVQNLIKLYSQSGIVITPEQAQFIIQKQNQQQNLFNAIINKATAPTQIVVNNTNGLVNEADLNNQIQSYRISGEPLEFTFDTKDYNVFFCNGKQILDSEGSINSYSVNETNGDITYTIYDNNNFIVKYTNGHSLGKAINVGKLKQDGNSFKFTGVTGVNMVADKYILLSDGLLFMRNKSMFIYKFGKDVESYGIPSGYTISNKQSNVTETGYIEIVKNKDQNADIFSMASKLTNIISNNGNQENEQPLFNYKKNKIHDIPFGWNAIKYWFNFQGRNFVIYRAEKTTKIKVADLDKNIVKTLFDSEWGFHNFKVRKNNDIISISAIRSTQIAITSDTLKIDNLIEWFDNDGQTIK